MTKKTLVLAALLGLFLQRVAIAQIVEYTDCQVRDPASFIGAVGAFHESMSGGLRPSVSIDAILWNGQSPATHSVIVVHENHAALEAAMRRVEGNTAGLLQLLNTVNNVATCTTEGLAVEIGFWGSREAPWEFYALYPLEVTDGQAYGAAFAELAEAQIRNAPGPIALYQNRAGDEDASHFVVYFSPSLATLNEFLDEVTAGDNYAEFVEEVRDIRALGTASQVQRVVTWDP